MPRLAILGTGGHAKVVIETARAAAHTIVGLFDQNPARHGASLLGVRILGDLEALRRADADGYVLAIGDNAARHRLAESLDGSPLPAAAPVVHPTAVLASDVVVGPGTVVFAGAILQIGTTVGQHVIVNTRAAVDHDGRIGDCVHLGPGSTLAGSVTVERGAFLGAGSVVIPGRTVGAWSTLGAGAVAVRDVLERTVVVGVPARLQGDKRA